MKTETKVENRIPKVSKSIIRKSPDVMYRAVMKGGGRVKAEAASHARSPKIGSAIKVIGKRPQNSVVESHTGFSRKAKGWYGKFFESGAKPHEIKPHKKKALVFRATKGTMEVQTKSGKRKVKRIYVTKKGKSTFAKSRAQVVGPFFKGVRHPGMQKDPLLAPAMRTTAPAVRQDIANGLAQVMASSAQEVKS